MDASLIPPGRYCYQVVKVREGEVLCKDISRFGMELRECRFHGDYKRILCPYWQTTEYGTVRCNFLGQEVVDEFDENASEKIAAHFGTADAMERVDWSLELSDELKICGVGEDEDEEWFVEE